MIIMDINITHQIIIMKKMKNNLFALKLVLTLLLTNCAVNPGMVEPKNFTSDDVTIQELTLDIVLKQNLDLKSYQISKGDTLSIVVFGQNDFFPITYSGINNPYTSKLVDEKGEIFFPYAGVIKAEGKTVGIVRNDITKKLEEKFNNPQVDVSISKFNSRRNVYVLGEVVRPRTIEFGLVPITLAEAISVSDGLSQTTSNAKKVFIIRKSDETNQGIIYHADLKDASKFVVAGEFNLSPGDIVFVGAADITKWNRFITQLFPFASFLNQVDSIQTN